MLDSRLLPLCAFLLAATIGCAEIGADDPGGVVAEGGGGSNATTSGSGGSGGTEDGLPICDCSLASQGCGTRLAELAQANGCEIPGLPEHDADLLACVDGSWVVAEICPYGCEVGTPETPEGCAAESLPVIAMDHLVLQAQVEPFRGDQPALPGDFAVEQVQMALVAEGFNATVDGWFGNETASIYAAWQEQLGFTGLDANGIPGPSSLAALGVDRFEIQRPISIGPKTTHSGKTVNQRTYDMIVAADALLDHSIVISQGSYNAGGVPASAGTHDGGGAVDVSVSSLTTSQRWKTVKAMRTVGFAVWLRNPNQGNWPYHIHAIAIGDTDLSVGARNQVADYYVGKNGLASHADDDTPAEYQVPFTWWEEYSGS